MFYTIKNVNKDGHNGDIKILKLQILFSFSLFLGSADIINQLIFIKYHTLRRNHNRNPLTQMLEWSQTRTAYLSPPTRVKSSKSYSVSISIIEVLLNQKTATCIRISDFWAKDISYVGQGYYTIITRPDSREVSPRDLCRSH